MFLYANVLESRADINHIFHKYSSNTFYGIHVNNAIKRYSVFTKIQTLNYKKIKKIKRQPKVISYSTS